MRKMSGNDMSENKEERSAAEAESRYDVKRLEQAAPAMLAWFDEHRREMPWRAGRNAYRIWISEIMLQQTRIETVKPYYERFMAELPDAAALAEVDDDRLMKLWQGLGYYSRARNLKKCAQVLVKDCGGQLPADYEKLVKLPGIGEYTAGAIASLAYGLPVPAVDGNVCRVLARFFADGRDVMQPAVRREARQMLTVLLSGHPEEIPSGAFNEMLMELGETVCLPNAAPDCGNCPAAAWCVSHAEGTEEQYPLRLAKKERRVEERTIFRLVSEGKYLLRKRPEKGLLAGLYEFPGEERNMAPEEAEAHLTERLGVPVTVTPLGAARHLFSHVEWRMVGYEADVPKEARPDGEWMSAEEIRERASVPGAFTAYLPHQ